MTSCGHMLKFHIPFIKEFEFSLHLCKPRVMAVCFLQESTIFSLFMLTYIQGLKTAFDGWGKMYS